MAPSASRLRYRWVCTCGQKGMYCPTAEGAASLGANHVRFGPVEGHAVTVITV